MEDQEARLEEKRRQIDKLNRRTGDRHADGAGGLDSTGAGKGTLAYEEGRLHGQ